MSENKYVIFTDSCSDLTPELYEDGDIHVVPLSFQIDGKDYMNYPDGREIDNHEFYERMRKGSLTKTSACSPGQYLEVLDPYCKDGYDVLIISFSSALSGSYNSAVQAQSYIKETYPERNIVVIDSLCASGGQGYITFCAGLNRKNGMSLMENKEWIETHILHMAHWFTVDDLHYLKRGGRLSASKAFLGTLLKLKPVLHVDNLGRLVPVETVRGRKQSLLAIMNHFKDTAIAPDKDFVMIIHGDDIVTAKFLGDKLQSEYHVPKVYYLDLGPVIGAHSGPGTISLFFMATER